MAKENYHLHTTISDGKLEPEELIKLAIKKKFTTIGITDHYMLPPKFKGENRSSKFYDFYSENDYNNLVKLRDKYADKISILIGAEFDWFPEHKAWTIKETKRRNYDYKFISMHFVKVGRKSEPIDLFAATFEDSVKKIGIQNLAASYYSELRQGIKTGCFDVVAHMDLIKMWNTDKKYFSGKEPWYKEQVSETLELIKKKKMKMEINSSGWRKACKEQYPAEWIIKDAIKLGIPIIIGTDGHAEENFEFGLKRAENLLKRLK
jgi:histidinol-phosphatase (PHP family)